MLSLRHGTRRLTLKISLCFGAMLVSSCTPSPIEMSITEHAGTIRVELFKEWWFGLRSSEIPCVHDIELVRLSDGQVFWRDTVYPEQQCRDLRFFSIGQELDGFRELVQLRSPLPPGEYGLTVRGIGKGGKQFSIPLE